MSNPVIQAENLGKQYNIAALNRKLIHDTLRDKIMSGTKNIGKHVFRRSRTMLGSEIFWALRNISFNVKQGDVFGIIGKNGAGKSTLLKILCRVTAPSEGRAILMGRVGSLLEVGTGFHKELTRRENIYLSGAILGMDKAYIDKRFDEIIEFSGVEKFIDTPIKRYSSGMHVRLGFAVAAHLEPEILLIDEVLAVGDVAFREKSLGKINEVSKEGRTVLLVSHNMASIRQLCTRAILLENGRIAKSGDSSEVIDFYLGKDAPVGAQRCFSDGESGRDSNFSFCEVKICRPSRAEPCDRIALHEGFDVVMDYTISSGVRYCVPAFHLSNQKGIIVLTSTIRDSSESTYEPEVKPGKYRVRCHVPPVFLRSGKYSIGISASIPSQKILADIPNAVSITVIDTGGTASITGHGRDGIISPPLKWLHERDLE